MSKGRVDTRIVWARIEGPVCNLFIILTYIPRKWGQETGTRKESKIAYVTHIPDKGEIKIGVRENWIISAYPTDGDQ